MRLILKPSCCSRRCVIAPIYRGTLVERKSHRTETDLPSVYQLATVAHPEYVACVPTRPLWRYSHSGGKCTAKSRANIDVPEHVELVLSIFADLIVALSQQ